MSALPPSFTQLIENGSAQVRRFLDNVQPVIVERSPEALPSEVADDQCWLWQGPVMKREGYGLTCGELVQRRAYRLFHGEIPDDKRVIRTCAGSLLCVNPRHLALATPTENAAHLGSDMFRNKLTPAQQEEIRQAVAEGGNQTEIARRYGVSTTTVSFIKNRKTSGKQRGNETGKRVCEFPFISATPEQMAEAEEHSALNLTAWLDLQARRLGPVGQLARGEDMPDEARERAISKATKEYMAYQLLSREYEARRSR